jgi:hypothetical protein
VLVPDDEQKTNIALMASEPTKAALMAGDTGVGKTLMSVEVAKEIGARVVLIIAPPNTLSGWRDTAEGQGLDLPFTTIDAKNLDAFTRLRKRQPGIYFVSRQFFALSGTDGPTEKRVKGKVVPVEKPRKKRWSWGWIKPDLTIYDEVQAVSNRYSQGFTCLKEIKTGYRLAASATPQGNKFEGIWSVCRWLWPKDINPKTGQLYVDNAKSRWIAEWCATESTIFTFSGFKVIGERVPGAFVNSLPCFVRMEAVRTPVEPRKCYVDLTPSQRRIYDEMSRNMLAWLDDHPLVADISIVQRGRLRQITLGEPTLIDTGEVDEDGMPVMQVDFDNECASAKIDALHKIINKFHPGEPMLILTDSAKFARVVTHRLGPLAREWSGRVNAKTREQIKAEFGKGDPGCG